MTTSHTSRRSDEPLLSVRDLSVTFRRQGQTPFTAVDGVSFDVQPGQTVGLVGESGCGKSVTSLAVMRLVPQPPGHYAGGRIMFEGRDLLALSPKEHNALRGHEIAMIYQDALSSLNPSMLIGRQLEEGLALHRKLDAAGLWTKEAEEALLATR